MDILVLVPYSTMERGRGCPLPSLEPPTSDRALVLRGLSRRAGSITRSRLRFSRRAGSITQTRRGFSRRAKTHTRNCRVLLSPRSTALPCLIISYVSLVCIRGSAWLLTLRRHDIYSYYTLSKALNLSHWTLGVSNIFLPKHFISKVVHY